MDCTSGGPLLVIADAGSGKTKPYWLSSFMMTDSRSKWFARTFQQCEMPISTVAKGVLIGPIQLPFRPCRLRVMRHEIDDLARPPRRPPITNPHHDASSIGQIRHTDMAAHAPCPVSRRHGHFIETLSTGSPATVEAVSVAVVRCLSDFSVSF